MVLGAFTLQQERPIGLRYLLATIALWFVCSGALVRLLPRNAWRVAAVAVGAGGLVAASVTPSLAWTSPLAGRGYESVADSNLDWGQGFYALQAWSKNKDPWVSYFGGAGLDVSEIPGAKALGRDDAGVRGWVAVSASNLYDYRRADLAWLRSRCPDQVLARTILVYDLDGRSSATTCGQASETSVPTRRNTLVTPRSSTSLNSGSVAVHVASIGRRWRATGDRLTTTYW
jgi:hypothetical protein